MIGPTLTQLCNLSSPGRPDDRHSGGIFSQMPLEAIVREQGAYETTGRMPFISRIDDCLAALYLEHPIPGFGEPEPVIADL